MKLKFLIKNIFSDLFFGLIISLTVYFFLFFQTNSKISINGQDVTFFFFFLLCFLVTMLFSFISTFSFLWKNKFKEKVPTYLREMPRSYSPSMVSVLTNMRLEYKKDVLADLIFLEQKGYISIQNGDVHPIAILEKAVDFEKGNKHLSDLLMYIKGKKQITVENILYDKESHNFSMCYPARVYEDLMDLDLVKRRPLLSKTPFLMILFVFIITFLYFFLFTNMSSLMDRFVVSFLFSISMFIVTFQVVLFVSLFFVVWNVARGRNYTRTKKGKEDVALWFSYYDFLKDFSALDKRELSEKKLWGYYFAYGLSLGLSTKIIQKFSLKKEDSMIR